MNYSLKIVTPPLVEPVTAGLVRLHAHISHTVEDPVIDMWIRASRVLAEAYLRRALITQTLELSFDSFPQMPIFIPRAPLQNIVSVKCFDYENIETTIDNSQFLIDTDSQPGRFCFNYGISWPSIQLRQLNSVKIRYVAGYGDDEYDVSNGELVPGSVPENIAHAICVYCTYHDENRAAELDSAPKQFYDLLFFNRLFV
ncbi:MAG: hypothetical protein JW915_23620 [Chitinispirillaceae bacterium]|nr:hypothetical protein [Chitinispirillaceae bacterium]